MEPTAPMSSAVTGLRSAGLVSLVYPTTILLSLSRRFRRSLERARIAIISDAGDDVEAAFAHRGIVGAADAGDDGA